MRKFRVLASVTALMLVFTLLVAPVVKATFIEAKLSSDSHTVKTRFDYGENNYRVKVDGFKKTSGGTCVWYSSTLIPKKENDNATKYAVSHSVGTGESFVLNYNSKDLMSHIYYMSNGNQKLLVETPVTY